MDDALLGNPWLDMASLVLLTKLGMDLLKPLIELAFPASRNTALHDAVLRLVLLALNYGGIVALAATAGALDWTRWPQYLVMAAGQAYGAHALYTSGKGRNGPSQPAQPAVEPATHMMAPGEGAISFPQASASASTVPDLTISYPPGGEPPTVPDVGGASA